MKNLNVYQIADRAAILYMTPFYMVHRVELFMQVDQLSELLHIQGDYNPTGAQRFPEDASAFV